MFVLYKHTYPAIACPDTGEVVVVFKDDAAGFSKLHRDPARRAGGDQQGARAVMSAVTPITSAARDAVLETVGHLQALAIMGVTRQQQETALKLATRLLYVLPLIDAATMAVTPPVGEPVMPSVDATTTDWFVYYREMIALQSRQIVRLHRIENAALRVASSRRGKIVTDQAPLDALDAALESQS